MDKKYIEENEIEIKYLRNQLTPEEVEEFEVYLMENPEVLERAELDALLSEGNGLATEKTNSAHWIAKIFSLFDKRVVSNLLAFSVGAVFVMALNPVQEGVETADLIYLSQTRSGELNADQVTKIKFEGNDLKNDQVILVLDVPEARQLPVRLIISSLRQKNAGTIVHTKLLTTNEFGTINLVLQEEYFETGRFQIEIFDQIDARQLVAAYRFEVDRD